MTYVIPAIDLMGGQCVRLHKGEFDQKTTYPLEPLEVAKRFEAEGAVWLHVVDLDGARDGERKHAKLIGEIVRETGLRVQTGGGIRTRDEVESLLDEGVERVVVGSLAVTDGDVVREWMSDLGTRRIVLALDVKSIDGAYRPAVRGWTETTEATLWDVLDRYDELGALLVTDISRDGVMSGGNLELYRELSDWRSGVELITSGGVGSLEDVRRLKALEPHGIIVGKALYENKFTLAEAVAC